MLFACLFVFLSFLWLAARPWSLIRELVVRLSAFLSTRGPASCLCSVLFGLSVLLLVALRRVVFLVSFSFAGVARLSCMFVVLGVRGFFFFFFSFACLFMP